MKRIRILCTACALLLCGCTNGTPETASQSAAETITEMPPQYTAADLQKAGIETEYRGDDLHKVEGAFYSEAIRTEEDALRAAASLAHLCGIADFQSEIRLDNSSTGGILSNYNFRQYHEGIPVTGNAITLTVRTETGEAVWYFCDYIRNITAGAQPALSAEDAQEAAMKTDGVKGAGEPELIYRNRNLAWRIDVSSTTDLCGLTVDAQTGEILARDVIADYYGGA